MFCFIIVAFWLAVVSGLSFFTVPPAGPRGPGEGQLVSGPSPGELCGNGVLDAGETCDDGNRLSGDGCDINCTFSGCGNGVIASSQVRLFGSLPSGEATGRLVEFNVGSGDQIGQPVTSQRSLSTMEFTENNTLFAIGDVGDVDGANLYKMRLDGTVAETVGALVSERRPVHDMTSLGEILFYVEGEPENLVLGRIDTNAPGGSTGPVLSFPPQEDLGLSFDINGSLFVAGNADDGSLILQRMTLEGQREGDPIGLRLSRTDLGNVRVLSMDVNPFTDQFYVSLLATSLDQTFLGRVDRSTANVTIFGTNTPFDLQGLTFLIDGEECEDGNTVDTDGCTNACKLPTCGDNICSTSELNDTTCGDCQEK